MGIKQFGNPKGVLFSGRVQRDSKVGCNFELISKTIKGVTWKGRVQRDSKVGGNWNCYSKAI